MYFFKLFGNKVMTCEEDEAEMYSAEYVRMLKERLATVEAERVTQSAFEEVTK